MSKDGYSTKEVAKLLHFSEEQVREFARQGVVEGGREGEPVKGQGKGKKFRFDFREVLVLRAAKRLQAEGGLKAVKVKSALKSVRQQIDADHPLSGIQVFVEGGKVVARDSDKSWEPNSGQCILPLEAHEEDATDLECLHKPKASFSNARVNYNVFEQFEGIDDIDAADAWFEVAMALEATEPERAYEGYLRTMACNPEHAEAMINIGRLCSLAGESKRAAAYFRQAVRTDPSLAVAHFNLAVTYHDQEDVVEAEKAYRQALFRDAHFAEAHFHLATLLDEIGRREEALKHMQTYEWITAEYTEHEVEEASTEPSLELLADPPSDDSLE